MVSTEMAEEALSPTLPPSPHIVGREFVRQYYTLLAEAPQFVHRFYSNESIFVHGTDEEIIGQQNIGQKIASIGFNGCRTRILALDAHETIAKGIVVQVVGEISVKGELDCMRRFVQTFVLAPQSEKKYYVHNDIFRYEDSVFDKTDEKATEIANDSVQVQDPIPDRPLVVSNGGGSTVANEASSYYPQAQQRSFEATGTPPTQAMQPPISISYGPHASLPQRTSASQAIGVEIHGSEGGGGTWTTVPSNTAHFITPSPAGPPPLPPSADPQPIYAQPQPVRLPMTQAPPSSFPQSMPSNQPQMPPPSSTGPNLVTTSGPAVPSDPVKESPNEDDQQRETSVPPVRSYANCLKQPKPAESSQLGVMPPAVSPVPASSPPGHQQMPPPRPKGDMGGQSFGNEPHQHQIAPDMPAGGRPYPSQQQQQHGRHYHHPPTGEYGTGVAPSRASPAPSAGGGPRRPLDQFPLEQCIFVRNIPRSMNENILKELLSQYGGQVLELKLTSRDNYPSGIAHAAMESVESARKLTQINEIHYQDGFILVLPSREPSTINRSGGPGGGGQRGGGMIGRGGGGPRGGGGGGGGRGRTYTQRGGGGRGGFGPQ